VDETNAIEDNLHPDWITKDDQKHYRTSNSNHLEVDCRMQNGDLVSFQPHMPFWPLVLRTATTTHLHVQITLKYCFPSIYHSTFCVYLRLFMEIDQDCLWILTILQMILLHLLKTWWRNAARCTRARYWESILQSGWLFNTILFTNVCHHQNLTANKWSKLKMPWIILENVF